MQTQNPKAMQPLDRVWAHPLPEGSGALLDHYAAIVADRNAVYLSTPITTGPKYLAWRQEIGQSLSASEEAYGDQLKRRVIVENISSIGPVAKRLQEMFPSRRVINPAELHKDAWTQMDYHRFWVEVIDRFVSTVIFADGWELSTGCTLEFLQARSKGIPCLKLDGSVMSTSEAIKLLVRASNDLRSAHLDSNLASATAQELTLDGSAVS